MNLSGRRGWLVTTVHILAVMLLSAVVVAVKDFLILAATYTVLDWWFPQALGPVAENPLRWALWVAVANALAGVLRTFVPLIPQIRSLAKGYRPGDFWAGKLRIDIRDRGQDRGLAKEAHLLRSAVICAAATLFTFTYVGGLPLDGGTVRIVLISVLALLAPDAAIAALRVVLGRRRPEATFDASGEFDRQLETLLRRDYPRWAGLSAAEFSQLVEPLRELLIESGQRLEQPLRSKRIPFVIVIRQELIPIDTAMQLVERRRKTGSSVIDPDELRRFKPIPTVEVPGGVAYLLIDVDLGWETRNRSADEGVEQIEARGRTPLTIEEGIALVTHHPEVLKDDVGFLLPGSRRDVSMLAALVIRKDKPRLVWWQEKRPSLKLGTPSCGTRLGNAVIEDETPTL